MMEVPKEDGSLVTDGSFGDPGYSVFGLPLAAVLCIIIVIYGLAVLICMFIRQVVLNRRPLATLEALHCCECLLVLPRPEVKICKIPCGQPTKSEASPCRINLEWLMAAVPTFSCRPPPRCWPLGPPAPDWPSGVRCCGLEIRRDARPTMVDAAVSSQDVLEIAPAALLQTSPVTVGSSAA